MPLSDDVLRGLRWGAILMAGLAIGVGSYRLTHESPPKLAYETAWPATAPQHTSGSVPIDESPDKPAVLTTRSRAVPPPPPARGRLVDQDSPRGASSEGALTGEPASKNEAESVVPEEKPDEPSAEAADEKEADQSAEQKIDPGAPAGPAALDESAATQDGRGKRLLKAVGRLLRIGRKVPQL